jgi:PAS domain S-box-containing protein
MLLGAPPMHPMSLTTAISVVLLGLGTMFARREHTLVGIFERPDLGGYLARRLFPAVLLIPLIIGSLNLLGTRAGVYSAEFGAAIPVVAMAVSLAVLTLGSAAALGRVDRERLRAIDRLQRSESLFRTIFDNTTIGMALVDERGRPIVTNPALQRMLGYSANEIARIPFGKFTHPDDVRVDVALFKEVLGRKRESYEIEKRYLRKDGSVLWGRLNAAAARDDSGRLLFLVGLVQDISERKKAEEGWRRLTAILEATPDVVGMTDEAGRVQYLNRAGRELTGLAESDLPRLSIADFHPQESAARILAEALPIALREGVWRGETALQGANGRLIPVSQVILAHRGSDGSVDFVSTVMRDITERKEEEENQKFLLEVSRAFSALLESDAVLHGITTLLVPRIADFCIVDVVKADGRIERSALKHADPDRQALLDRLAGSAPVAGRGVGVAQTVASAESRLIGEVVPAWIAADSTSEEDARVIAELAPRSAMIVPLVAGGRVLGVITCASTSPDRRYAPKDLGLVENVAARAALALEAARLFRESQEATRVRDEVLRVVAHDLRNPLHTISLTADLLRERLGPAVQTDEGNRLDVIRRSVDQAKHLIEDLLDVARMEAGRLTIDPTPLDPAALVREAADLHSSQAAERSLRLDTDFAEASGPVLADRARILQVFANLIGNAIRFSPEGGQVTVRAKRENGGIRFSISDQGPGITEESMPHLFDPFWQAATTGTGGAGLGLAIARGIVEAHGGRIWAESVPGSGSTFHFTVPAAPASSAAADAAA